jgi:hypothetical protein
LVATIELDSSKTRNGASPPISLHPAFPAVRRHVVRSPARRGQPGSCRASCSKRPSKRSVLVALVPAALPLGLAGRSLIAVALAIAGALAGAAIARRLARAHGARPWIEDTGVASGPRRPISVNEEIGGYGLPIPQGTCQTWAEDDLSDASPCMAPLPPATTATRLRSTSISSSGVPAPLLYRLRRLARTDVSPCVSAHPRSPAAHNPRFLAGPQPAATRSTRSATIPQQGPVGLLPVGERGLVQLVETPPRLGRAAPRNTRRAGRGGAARFDGSPAKTGAALRDALATLQRLRGAA